MNDEKTFKSLKERIAFIQRDVDLLTQNQDRSFADDIIYRSLDSHLSDLKQEQRAIENRHPLQDFMELRLKGVLVDFGTIPLDILSVISGNIALLVQKAVHRIGSGKDSRKVPAEVKNALNMRLADLTPGSTRLGVTFSTGSCELIETVSSQAVKEIFSLLSATDDETFMAKVAEIGSQSTSNLKKIIDECEKNSLNFDLTWIGPFTDGTKRVSVSHDGIRQLNSRLALTKVTKLPDEHISGELAVLSMYGKIEISGDTGKIKASYPIDMLAEIQEKYKVGQKISLTVSVSEIHNERIGTSRRNYMVKSVN
ncbi:MULTISPECIES: hypothetical protein [Edwardsiella]|uniref:hypothetical protein n=1 Tax=Edwardsiella TaxID=635 RepID=UPI000D523097|nr:MULTISPECIES: hypothetical protein [Edwardsiella]UCQ23720.1 hypothetical protein DCE91_13260 [Edwardsiella piscicida]WKS81904.1 hypothetical protein NHU85_03650 [Edwardsiella tarda]